MENTQPREVTLDVWVKHFAPGYSGFCYDLDDCKDPKEVLRQAGFQNNDWLEVYVTREEQQIRLVGEFNGNDNSSHPAICYLSDIIDPNEALRVFKDDTRAKLRIVPYQEN